MNKRIIYTNAEGGVSVIIPTLEALEHMPIEEIAQKDVPVGVSAEIVDASTIPTDRTFRNAWEKASSAIVHNIVKCKEIAHDKRRRARDVEMAPLDIEATIPSKAAQAEAKRQVIRDKYAAMQSSIDAATTVEQLKSIIVSL